MYSYDTCPTPLVRYPHLAPNENERTRSKRTRFIPSRVLDTRHTSLTAYNAHSSSNGRLLCMKWIGINSTVPNRPLILPTSSFTVDRRFWYSSTSCRDGTASCTNTTCISFRYKQITLSVRAREHDAERKV